MLAVIDTNVLVSALINRHGSPSMIVEKIRTLELIPVVTAEILEEYATVLRRARFGFEERLIDALLADMQGIAQSIQPARVSLMGLPDMDDAAFIAAALAAACPVVTGNTRHFSANAGVEVLSPAECLQRLLKA